MSTLLRGGTLTFTWDVRAPVVSCNALRDTFSVGGESRSYGETFPVPAASGTSRINCPPVAVIAPPTPAECEAERGTVRLDGSGSFDPNGDPITFAWSAPGIAFDDPASPTPAASFPFGATTVRLVVSDGELTDDATATAVVQDTILPDVPILRPTPGNSYVLDQQVHASPGGQMTVLGPLTVRAEASDRCKLLSVAFRAPDGTVTVLEAPPFTLLVDAPALSGPQLAGVQVTALDLGGNTRAAAVDFLHQGTACKAGPTAPVCAFLPDSLLAPDALKALCLLLAPEVVCGELFGLGGGLPPPPVDPGDLAELCRQVLPQVVCGALPRQAPSRGGSFLEPSPAPGPRLP